MLKFSALLLIPLIFNYLHYIIQYFCITNIEVMDNTLCFNNLVDKKHITTLDAICQHMGFYDSPPEKFMTISLTKEFIIKYINEQYSEKATIAQHFNFYKNILLPIKTFEISFDLGHKKKYLPYFHTILYTSYAVCWGYILYFGW